MKPSETEMKQKVTPVDVEDKAENVISKVGFRSPGC
jgi:hypothetical protein